MPGGAGGGIPGNGGCAGFAFGRFFSGRGLAIWQIEYHPNLSERGEEGLRFSFPGASKPAFEVQLDGRTVSGRDPQR